MDSSKQNYLISQYIAAYNAFDIEGMIAPLHEEVVFQNISGGIVTHESSGLAAFRETAQAGARLFSTREQRITRLLPSVEAGDPSVKVDIDYHAVLASDLPNGMKAGEDICMKGWSEFRFRDNRIVSIVDHS